MRFRELRRARRGLAAASIALFWALVLSGHVLAPVHAHDGFGADSAVETCELCAHGAGTCVDVTVELPSTIETAAPPGTPGFSVNAVAAPRPCTRGPPLQD
jgi:hypothetical protein